MNKNIIYCIIIFFSFFILGNVKAYEPNENDLIYTFKETYSKYYFKAYLVTNENRVYFYDYTDKDFKNLKKYSFTDSDNNYITYNPDKKFLIAFPQKQSTSMYYYESDSDFVFSGITNKEYINNPFVTDENIFFNDWLEYISKENSGYINTTSYPANISVYSLYPAYNSNKTNLYNKKTYTSNFPNYLWENNFRDVYGSYILTNHDIKDSQSKVFIKENLSSNKNYEYNKTINCSDKNYVKVLFEMNDLLVNNNGSFDFNFDLKFNENEYVSPPVLRHIFNINDPEALDTYYSEEEIFNDLKENMYSGEHSIQYNEDLYTTNILVSLEIDVSNYDKSIDLSFISNTNYVIEYVFDNNLIGFDDYGEHFDTMPQTADSNLKNNIIKVDLKNYAGIVLYPKVWVKDYLNTKYLTRLNGLYNFYIYGRTYNISLMSKIETLINNKNYKKNYFHYNFENYNETNDDLYDYFLIENNQKNSPSYIIFDEKYYAYKLVENTYDEIIITNPNYGNEETLDSIFDTNIKNDENKSVIDSLTNIEIETDKGAFSYLSSIYKLLRKSYIGPYILIIIVTSILLLIINAFKR